MLQDFFDTGPDQFQGDKPWSPDAKLLTQPVFGYEIQYLIMTIPEPDSAPLRYKFDTYLDAVDAAANAAGFVPDSFDLPWLKSDDDQDTPFELGQPIDVTDPHGSIERTLEPDRAYDTRTDHDPGILLFRNDQANNNGHKSLLMLFLVGESPTSGVSRGELRSALDQIAWLSGWRSQPNESPPLELSSMSSGLTRQVKILGPTFSGSADSLRLTIDARRSSFVTADNLLRLGPPITTSAEQACPVPSANDLLPWICIISGTVTGTVAGISNAVHEPGVTYHTMSVSDEQMWPWIINDLQRGVDTINPAASAPDAKSHNNEGPSIAVLVEDTSYGKTAIPTNDPSIRTILFPLHISDLRTAFGNSQAQTTPSVLGILHHDLPLANDGDEERERDVVPAFSKRDAIYDELVLGSLLTTFHRDRIRYVGIVATDVEDLIFLAHQVRDFSPNTVIFTTHADIRYLHSDVNNDLKGMLVFSSYPLFSIWFRRAIVLSFSLTLLRFNLPVMARKAFTMHYSRSSTPLRRRCSTTAYHLTKILLQILQIILLYGLALLVVMPFGR